jgi:hypothetical protein
MKIFTTEPRLACGQFCLRPDFGGGFAIFIAGQRLPSGSTGGKFAKKISGPG